MSARLECQDCGEEFDEEEAVDVLLEEFVCPNCGSTEVLEDEDQVENDDDESPF